MMTPPQQLVQQPPPESKRPEVPEFVKRLSGSLAASIKNAADEEPEGENKMRSFSLMSSGISKPN